MASILKKENYSQAKSDTKMSYKYSLVALAFFFSMFMIPSVSAFEWCEWIPFWECTDDNGNTLTANGQWTFLHETGLQEEYFDWTMEVLTSSDKVKICMLPKEEMRINNPIIQATKAYLRKNGVLTGTIEPSDMEIETEGGNVKKMCVDVDFVNEDFIKFGANSTAFIYEEETLRVVNENGTVLQDVTLEYNTEQCILNCKAGGRTVIYENSSLFDNFDFVDTGNTTVNLSNANIFLLEEGEDYNVSEEILYDNCTQAQWDEQNATNSTIYGCSLTAPSGNFTNVTYQADDTWDSYNFQILPTGSYDWEIRGRKDDLSSIDWAVAFQGFDTDTIRQYWAWWNSSWANNIEISNITGEYVILNLSKPDNGKDSWGDTRFLDPELSTELNYTFRELGGATGTAYADYPTDISTNLEAYWKFDAGTTDSHGSFDLTTTNSPQIVTGFINNAIDFESSSSQYASRASGDLFPAYADPFSINLWWKPESLSTDQYLVSKAGDVSTNYGRYHIVYRTSSNTVEYLAHDGSSVQHEAKVSGVEVDKWHMVTITNDGAGNMNIYLNGMAGSSDFLADYRDTGESDFYIGRSAYSIPFYLDGIIDEFAWVDAELSEDQIRELYQAQYAYVTIDTNFESDNATSRDTIEWYYNNPAAETTESASDTYLTPESYYYFDKDTKDYIDSNPATNNGATATTGYIGGAYDYDGSTDYMSDAAPIPYADFSIGAWVNLDTIAGGHSIYTHREETNSNSVASLIMANGAVQLTLRDNGGGGIKFILGSTIVNTGEWNYVSATFDQSTGEAKVFLNGVQEDVETYTGGTWEDAGSVSNNIFGARSYSATTSNYLDGEIDEVGIWYSTLNTNNMYELFTMSDQTDYVTLSSPNVDFTIAVTLIEPENNTFFTVSDIDFQCNCIAQDDNCTQINLTIDDVVVETDTGTGNFNLTSTETVSEGNHYWNCYAANQTGTVYNASNFYFGVDSTPPVITIDAPTDGFTITEYNQSFDLNWTLDEVNPGLCWYNFSIPSNSTFVDCELNTTTVNYPASTPDNVTLYLYTTDLSNYSGVDSVFIQRSFVAPVPDILFPADGFIITDYNQSVNFFYNYTANNTDKCFYNTSESSTKIYNDCINNFSTFIFPTSNPENLTIYFFINDTLGNLGSDTLFVVKNNETPNITIFEPFLTYDSIDIGDPLGLNTTTTTASVLDSCWYTYPNPWNMGAAVSDPITAALYDNNDSTFENFFDYNFYFDNTASNLTYRGGDCTTGSNCTELYNVTIDTSGCSLYDEYNIVAADIAQFGCDRQLNLTCGDELLYTETSTCLLEPHNMTVDLYSSSSILTTAPDNAISYTCNALTSFNYSLNDNTVFVYANDTLGNFGNTNRTWVSVFNIANETFEPEVLVSQTNDFRLDVVTSASSIINPKLIYNGVAIDATLITLSGTEFYLTASVLTYENYTGTNEFFWNVTLDGTEYSSTPSEQNVSDIEFGICGGGLTTTFFRVNFIDETTSSPLASTIRASSFDYWIDDQEALKTYDYGVTTNSTLYEFCFTPSEETINVDGSISYNSDGYPERTAGVTTTMSNATTNVTLSLLGIDDGIYATFTFIDSVTKVGLDAVTVDIYDAGTLVIATVTDSSGSISEWLNPNILYQVDYSKTGYASGSQNRRPISTDPLIIEMDSEAFEVEPELGNGLYTVIYPISSDLDANEIYDFGFFASEGDVEIESMTYTVYDEDGVAMIAAVERTGQGNMTQSAINVSDNDFVSITAIITGTNGETIERSRTFIVASFQSTKYSLDQWGLTFNSYFPANTRTTLVKFVMFILWFLLLITGFSFGYNGSFKKKEDYTDNVSPEARGNTSTGLLFMFLITILFSYFNLIPAPFIPGDGSGMFTNGMLQRNFFAAMLFIILVIDLLKSTITKYFRKNN